MTQRDQKEWLNRRVGEAVARYARTRGETHRRSHQPPQPGDVFVFPQTATFCVQWAIVDQDPQDDRRLLVMALDSYPLVGSTDVRIPADAPTGASCLRCDCEMWIHAKHFDPSLRTGFLESPVLHRARRKRSAILSGNLLPTTAETETDAESDYQDWREQTLKKAQEALAEGVRSGAGTAAQRRSTPLEGDSTTGELAHGVDWTQPMRLTLRVDAGEDADAEEVDELAYRLLSEMRELDVEWIALLRSEEVPVGARSIDAGTLGTLGVEVLPSLLPLLLEFLRGWLIRGNGSRVTIHSSQGDRKVVMEDSVELLDPTDLKRLAAGLIGNGGSG